MDTVYQIRVENPEGINHGVKRIVLDGSVLEATVLPRLGDGGIHAVTVTLG